MTLHLVRLAVSPRGLSSYAVAGGISDDDGGYAVHCALRGRFQAAGPQPFRFFPEHRGGAHVLGYVADRAALEDAIALPVADPLLRGVFAAAPDVQPMPEAWREGARYAFEVRVRPVVRYGSRIRAERAGRSDAWQKRAGEVDVFVAACERAGEGVPVDREAVYGEWLARQLGGAADLDKPELRQLRRTRARRRVHEAEVGAGRSSGDAPAAEPRRSRTRAVDGPDAIMAGTLTVRDPAAFARALARGVGRHTAFGFGMLLLSPPGRAG